MDSLLTTHALARLLLAGPDEPVVIRHDHGDRGDTILSVVSSAPMDDDGNLDPLPVWTEGPRVTMIDATYNGCIGCGTSPGWPHRADCPAAVLWSVPVEAEEVRPEPAPRHVESVAEEAARMDPEVFAALSRMTMPEPLPAPTGRAPKDGDRLDTFTADELDALPIGAAFCLDGFVPFTKYAEGWLGMVGQVRYRTAAEVKTTPSQERRVLSLTARGYYFGDAMPAGRPIDEAGSRLVREPDFAEQRINTERGGDGDGE